MMHFVYITFIIVFGSLSFMSGYNSGYNRGYDAGICSTLPYKEAIGCWERLR